MRESLPGNLADARRTLRHCRDDHPPTLDARCDRHRFGRRVPRWHGRERRPQEHRRGPAGLDRQRLRGAELRRRAGTWPCWQPCSSWPALCPIDTAGGASTRSDWSGSHRTSALCGLAPTLEWLVVFRLLQGGAGALLIPGSLALITHAFDGPERGRAFGIWAASTSALIVAGPIIGGILVDTIGWRVAFLINVPILAGRAVGDHRPRSGVTGH